MIILKYKFGHPHHTKDKAQTSYGGFSHSSMWPLGVLECYPSSPCHRPTRLSRFSHVSQYHCVFSPVEKLIETGKWSRHVIQGGIRLNHVKLPILTHVDLGRRQVPMAQPSS